MRFLLRGVRPPEAFEAFLRASPGRVIVHSCPDQVVQAYLLLSTVETMRGHEDAGKRYLDHAHTMHTGNAMGPEGQLRQGRHEQEESLDLVFQIYGQPDGSVGHFSTAPETFRNQGYDGLGAGAGDGSGGQGRLGRGRQSRGSTDAVSQMIAQAMSPPSESQSGPLKALKYLSTACGLSSEVFDPTNKCVTVKQYLGEMDAALKVTWPAWIGSFFLGSRGDWS